MFAANEPGQPDGLTPLESVVTAPPRASSQPADHEVTINLPPVTKQPPTHPNLVANLNPVVEESASSQNPASTESSSSNTAVDPILVICYVNPEHVDDVRQYQEDNRIYVRNVGDDYI